MTQWLIRRFVPRSEAVQEPFVRTRYGIVAGAVGVVCNILLFLAKITIGLLSGSVAIFADAVNNLADASSSIITLVGFRLAGRPADEEHPYGHARFEYLAGLGVALLILVIGAETLKSAVRKIIQPEPIVFSVALFAVLILAIALKLWMMSFNSRIGRRIGSATLMATGADSRNDVISTSGVLLSAVVAYLTGWELDGYVGLLVALFILYSGISIGKDTLRPLIGSAAEPELLLRLKQVALDYHPMILGVHDLIVHDYGPSRCFATLHAEVDYREDVLHAHEIIDGLERHFKEEEHVELVVHYDPIVTDDDDLNALRPAMLSCLGGLDARLGAHDFRLVRASGGFNLIFDVTIPYDLSKKEADIAAQLQKAARVLYEECHTIVCFDYQGMRPDKTKKKE